MRPGLIISLDFELMWGVLDSKTLEGYGPNILGAHKALPAILDLLERYQVKATVALVGLLLYDNASQLREAFPEIQPTYEKPGLSPYVCPMVADNSYFFAPAVVRELLTRKTHELATHTFCHYYCGESGQTVAQFTCDLHAAIEAGRLRHGEPYASIVFPRNQIRDEYLKVCHDLGLKAFRGNQTSWLYRTSNRGRLGRFLRYVDSYFDLSGPNSFGRQQMKHPSGLVNLPASAFLRPHNPKLPFLDALHCRRLTTAMHRAAQKNEIFHLWWHPHNFGLQLEKNLDNLERLLRTFADLSSRYGMRSLTMSEGASLV